MELEEADSLLVGVGSHDWKGNPANRRKTGGWRSAPCNFVMEFTETMGFLGLQIDLVLYLIREFNFGHTKAATTVTNFAGTAFLCSLLGGFLADAYWGRFTTILVGSGVEITGMALMTASASISAFRPPHCSLPPCTASASTIHLSVLYVGLFLTAIGSGTLKPCLSSLGADQFDPTHQRESRLSPVYFNWFFFSFVAGGLLGVTVLVYIQDNVGFGAGYGVCLGILVLGLCVFAAGFPLYRYKYPFGSPLTRILQVLVAASRNSGPVEMHRLYEIGNDEAAYLGVQKLDHTNHLRFLDRAAACVEGSKPGSKWRVCTVTQVEETKAILRLMPIWAGTIVMTVVLAQLQTFTVEQGVTMERRLTSHFEFPAGSIPGFPLLIMAVLVPLYDKVFVPFARRFTRHERGITILQRVGVGLVLSIVSMILAALVENRRIRVAGDHGLLDDMTGATVPMSIFWLVPQYFAFGIADMFTLIGVLEFFYDQAPPTMRSFSQGLSYCTIALGFFISTAVVNLVNNVTGSLSHGPGWLSDSVPFNRKKIDRFYWLMAVLSSLNFIYFLCVSYSYKYQRHGQRITSTAVVSSASGNLEDVD